MSQELIRIYKERGQSGLKNLGNTCFINSAVQCLSNTLELTHYLIDELKNKKLSRSQTNRKEMLLVTEYTDVVDKIWNNNHVTIPPNRNTRVH